MSATSLPPLPTPSKSRPLSSTAYALVAAGLLLMLAAELFLSTRLESQTFDEADHLYAGFEYWKHADFGRNPEHPPLAKLVAALPLLPMRLKEPSPAPIPFFKLQDFIDGGHFLYGANADSMLARSRGMIGLFSLAPALLVLAAGREMFGREAGLLALALLVLEPTVLANGALVTTDMALTCLFFLSIYTFYRFAKRPGVARLALCAIAVGLTLSAKHSGILVAPVLALLALWEAIWGRRLTAIEPGDIAEEDSARRGGLLPPHRSFIASAGLLLGALAAIAVISYVVLWGVYGFRYAARPGSLQITPTLSQYVAMIPVPPIQNGFNFFARHRLVPEAYLYGWFDILTLTVRPTFVLGKLYSHGQFFFFPVVFVVKTTITLMVLLVTVLFTRPWRRRREFVFLLVPAVVFLSIAVLSRMNLGVRHILPVYPFLFLLAAAAGWELARRSRAWTIALAVLVLFAAVSSLRAFPNYLAYSNEAFGGPSNTYRELTDSNVDWGQGLKATKRYLDQNHITDCWFDYSNPFVPLAAYGIDCKPLPNSWALIGVTAPIPDVPETISGTVLISAIEQKGLLWGPGDLNPYDQFNGLRPVAEPADSILVYQGTFHVPLASAYSHGSEAIALTQQKKFPEALAEGQAAAKLAPQSAAMQVVLARTLIAAGQTDQGHQAIGTAMSLANADHPEFQGMLFWMIQQASTAK